MDRGLACGNKSFCLLNFLYYKRTTINPSPHPSIPLELLLVVAGLDQVGLEGADLALREVAFDG